MGSFEGQVQSVLRELADRSRLERMREAEIRSPGDASALGALNDLDLNRRLTGALARAADAGVASHLQLLQKLVARVMA